MRNIFERLRGKDHSTLQRDNNHEIIKIQEGIIEEWKNQTAASVLKDPDYQNLVKLIEENNIVLLKHLETSKVLNESLKSISEDIFEKYQKENPCTVDIESHERLKKMFQNDLSRMMAPLSGKYGFGDISSKRSV